MAVGSAFTRGSARFAIGVAILRYRLYDIDRLVSRTVSWAVVTGVLVVVGDIRRRRRLDALDAARTEGALPG